MPDKPKPPSTEIPKFETVDELLRVAVVSEVRAKLAAGQSLDVIVAELAARTHVLLDGTHTTVSPRSVYRWHAAFKRDDWKGLRTGRREKGLQTALPAALLDFMREEKKLDRYASIPELLRRAREKSVLDADFHVDRVTAWRNAKQLGLPIRRVPAKHEIDYRSGKCDGDAPIPRVGSLLGN